MLGRWTLAALAVLTVITLGGAAALQAAAQA
jgi:hypothetical protein